MNNTTLLTVNWNQRPCLELMLKTYVKFHYNGVPLRVCIVDNGSDDGSKEWLRNNRIPFIDLQKNIWHEPAVNLAYPFVRTKYCLLCDTDIQFNGSVLEYLGKLQGDCISAGEYIDWDTYGEHKIMPRISPWFWLFDIETMRSNGVDVFREGDNWLYDVGSWYWEKMKNLGFSNYHIGRLNANQDTDLISMVYPKYFHIGKVSWDLSRHQSRSEEVQRRREYIKIMAEGLSDIDLSKRKYFVRE